MISIIICSANPFTLHSVKKNVLATIGLPHEIIAIDNPDRQYGICKAYNEGAARAKFPYLCFMHEDISFDTHDWGQRVVDHLSDERTGLLGIAGGDARSLVPSSWSGAMVSNEINIYQHYKSRPDPPEHIVVSGAQPPAVRRRVVALDGVWLCTRKTVWDQFQFDEEHFRGFHGYDIDYSLQVGTRYDLFVVFDIVIHHFSEGRPDRGWMESAIRVSKKWRHRLPVSVYPPGTCDYGLHHWQSMQVFLQHLLRLRYDRMTIWRYLCTWGFTRFFSIRRFLSMGKYLVSNSNKLPKKNYPSNHQNNLSNV
jgi:hypothetical protein